MFEDIFSGDPSLTRILDPEQQRYAKSQAFLQLAASLLSGGVGRRPGMGEAFANAFNDANKGYNAGLQTSAARQMQNTQDVLKNQLAQAHTKLYEQQALHNEQQAKALERQAAQDEANAAGLTGLFMNGVPKTTQQAVPNQNYDPFSETPNEPMLQQQATKNVPFGQLSPMEQLQATIKFLPTKERYAAIKAATSPIHQKKDEMLLDPNTMLPLGPGNEKQGKIIDKSVDLGDKQLIQYADGTERIIPKGVNPNTVFRIDNRPEKQAKTLPTNAIKDLGEFEDKAVRFNNLINTFNDSFGGKTIAGGLSTTAAKLGLGDPKQVAWWQDYKEVDAIRRNAIFGASLTGNEKKSWDEITVSERSDPGVIRSALKAKLKIVSDVANRRIKKYGQFGYDVSGYEDPLSQTDSGDAAPESVPTPGKHGKYSFSVK